MVCSSRISTSSAQVDGQSCGQADAPIRIASGRDRIGLFTAASPPMSGTERQQQILAAGAPWSLRRQLTLFLLALLLGALLGAPPHAADQQHQDRSDQRR